MKCVEAHNRINNPATIRRLVEERDHAICALCGKDCERDRKIARETEALWYWLARRHAEEMLFRRELPAPWGDGMAVSIGECSAWAWRWVAEQKKERGWGDDQVRHTWEADHIVPVAEGGGQCGLENYRTLCLVCHRRETAELARRRAEARRNAKRKGVPELKLAP